MRTLLLTILATGLLAACSPSTPDVSPEKQSNLLADDARLFGRTWINSYEAKPNEIPTYRPENYTWATQPQRYNMPIEGGDGFRLNTDGSGVYIAPGIGTGPITHPITWQRSESGKSIFRLHITDNSRPDMQVEIVSVGADRLTARYLP
ncbi:hypothetical protein J7E24_15695 [Hymenobacter sp. ISL-91]|uniref:hypothetical protein n=1 Tax=Hymenobacter sp. ISL-91 TaxID=2819151 RepID=UPI001BEAE60E|nr:hypothetical protein [Hymenobacter sp. ISL-91]MBT2559232.1 hypothetical protein [Hymenobacter sp. ISL-91]